MTAEQIQSAIERAKRTAECCAGTCNQAKSAIALLDVYGRLQDAEAGRTNNWSLFEGQAKVSAELRAELTEARKELAEEHRNSDELSSECEDHTFLVTKVKRVIRHVAGNEGIHSGAQFDSLMADVRDLATVTINERSQVTDTLQRSLTEARRQLDITRKAIADAPHDENCEYIDSLLRYATTGRKLPTLDCNCWKSQITPTETPK